MRKTIKRTQPLPKMPPEMNTDASIEMQRLFGEAGLNPNSSMEIGSNETIKQAVMVGLGSVLISADTVYAELQGGRLNKLDG